VRYQIKVKVLLKKKYIRPKCSNFKNIHFSVRLSVTNYLNVYIAQYKVVKKRTKKR